MYLIFKFENGLWFNIFPRIFICPQTTHGIFSASRFVHNHHLMFYNFISSDMLEGLRLTFLRRFSHNIPSFASQPSIFICMSYAFFFLLSSFRTIFRANESYPGTLHACLILITLTVNVLRKVIIISIYPYVSSFSWYPNA